MASSSEEELAPILPATWQEGAEITPDVPMCLEQIQDLAAPVPLIRVDKVDGKEFLKIGEEAQRWLESAGNKKIVVSSIAGPYRTGKSFLLNLIVDAGTHRNAARFDVGSSIRACTEGVWMWGLSLSTDAVHLVLDFEGMSDLLRNPERDARMLTLALLVSDYVIFNTKGVIDEGAIQSLKSISRLADHVRRHHSPSRRRESIERDPIDPDVAAKPVPIAKFLGHQHWVPPALLWVLRDFSLLLRDSKGNSMSPNEYLDLALNEPPEEGFRPSTVRDTRYDICSFFSRRECVTLLQPVDDEEDLQRLPTLPIRDLRPEFRRQVVALRKKIFFDTSLHAKSHFAMSGRAFVRLLGRYIDSLNSGDLPNVHWTWDTLQRDECEVAVGTCFADYKRDLAEVNSSTVLPCRPDELLDVLSDFRRRALRNFSQLSFGEQHIIAEQQLNLLAQIDVAEARKIEENNILSESRSREMLDELCRPIESKLRGLEYEDLDQLRSDIKNMSARFHEAAPLSELAKRTAVADRASVVLNQGLNAVMEHQKTLLNEQLLAAQNFAQAEPEPDPKWLKRQAELEAEVEKLRVNMEENAERDEARKETMENLCREISLQRDENTKLGEILEEKEQLLAELQAEAGKKKKGCLC